MLKKDSWFCLFFGRIEDTINCFRDLLTLSLSSLYSDAPTNCSTYGNVNIVDATVI